MDRLNTIANIIIGRADSVPADLFARSLDWLMTGLRATAGG